MRLWGKNLSWAFGTLGVVVLIALVLMSVSVHALGGQANLSQFLTTHSLIFFLFRMGLIVSFILLWPFFIGGLAKRYALSEDVKTTLIGRRYRYALWLVIINIALVWL